MIDFLLAVLQAFWAIMKEASVYLLVGFLLAGVLAVLVPRQLLTRLVGTGKLKSVLWGSVLGAPLPLCSCGVLPTAVGLRKEGATPGATVAFLVAPDPESSLVYETMVGRAEVQEISQAGGAAVGPVLDVVGVEEEGVGTGGEGTAAVA